MFNVCRDRAAKAPLSGKAARRGPMKVMKGRRTALSGQPVHDEVIAYGNAERVVR
jgi:hypothetical protein